MAPREAPTCTRSSDAQCLSPPTSNKPPYLFPSSSCVDVYACGLPFSQFHRLSILVFTASRPTSSSRPLSRSIRLWFHRQIPVLLPTDPRVTLRRPDTAPYISPRVLSKSVYREYPNFAGPASFIHSSSNSSSSRHLFISLLQIWICGPR